MRMRQGVLLILPAPAKDFQVLQRLRNADRDTGRLDFFGTRPKFNSLNFAFMEELLWNIRKRYWSAS